MVGRRSRLNAWWWSFRFNWRCRWYRFAEWNERQWCLLLVLLRYRDPKACRGCGRADLDGWDPDGFNTWCPSCCPDHDYQRDDHRGHSCVRCGEPRPEDWGC